MAEITDSTPQGGNEAEGTRMSRNARSRSLAVMLAAAGSLLVLAGTPVAASAATTSTAAPATLSPSGTYHFSVPANSVVTNAWGATVPDYRTGLVVGAGIVVSVTATGQWSYAPGKWVGPDGHYGSQGLTAQVTTNPDPAVMQWAARTNGRLRRHVVSCSWAGTPGTPTWPPALGRYR